MADQSPPVYRLNPFRIAALILRARALSKRERWSREQIQRHQSRELARLRQFASVHSPFYQRFHKGLEGRPLHELPILTKQELMRSWDDIVTDRSLHLKDIQRLSRGCTGSRTVPEYTLRVRDRGHDRRQGRHGLQQEGIPPLLRADEPDDAMGRDAFLAARAAADVDGAVAPAVACGRSRIIHQASSGKDVASRYDRASATARAKAE